MLKQRKNQRDEIVIKIVVAKHERKRERERGGILERLFWKTISLCRLDFPVV
jgi:hypothetical protein